MSGEVLTPSFTPRQFGGTNGSEVDVPIQINSEWDVWIRPGDIIIGDADGVVCLPASLAVKVLEILPGLVAGMHLLDRF